jgi:hypothetical protein
LRQRRGALLRAVRRRCHHERQRQVTASFYRQLDLLYACAPLYGAGTDFREPVAAAATARGGGAGAAAAAAASAPAALFNVAGTPLDGRVGSAAAGGGGGARPADVVVLVSPEPTTAGVPGGVP